MIIPIENYLQVWTLALSGASIAIAWIAVILRLVAKHIRRKFDYSDYCIVAALVPYHVSISQRSVTLEASIAYAWQLVSVRKAHLLTQPRSHTQRYAPIASISRTTAPSVLTCTP